MAKQYFNTKAEAGARRLSTIVFFIIAVFILAFAVYALIGFSKELDTSGLPGRAKMYTLAVIAVVQMFMIFFLPAIGIFFGIQRGRKKGYRERATFNSTLGITYYRDILKDVSPADLSIIMDLKIDSCKDISATLLRLYNKKVIDFENNRIVPKSNNAFLDGGEQELLAMIGSAGITKSGINTWKQNRKKEAESKGLVEKCTKPKGCAGCGSGCLGMIVVIICFIAISFFVASQDAASDEYDSVINRLAEENAVVSAEDIEVVNKFLSVAVAVFAFVNIIMVLPAYSLFRIIAYSIIKASTDLVRTKKGNELAEKAAGLKRFINEFSTLSEKRKEEVMLWDDFLVYAVVLEENERIIEDINKYYKGGVSLNRFMVNI